jgi:adenylosuccinate lyase
VSDLFWPGAERAGSVMTDAALLAALVAVEAGWLAALVAAGVAPSTATDDLAGLVGDDDVAELSLAAEGGGNPDMPLVELLRSRVSARNGEAGRWMHRGLTSQDVLDTALMLCSRDALDRLHTAAAESVDERSDGGWHTEGAALHSLTRTTVVASSQAGELLDGLVVHADLMRARLDSVAQDVLAEQRSLASVIGPESDGTPGPEGYLGASDLFISAVLERAARFDKDPL